MKTIALWLLRKAVYTALGAAVAFVAVYVKTHGGPDYNFETVKLAAVVAGVGSAVFGDLRRALLPDFLQIATGTDPRNDG